MNSARRSNGAKFAIPSHLVLLTNPVSSSTQPQGIMSNTPQAMWGVRVCACCCVSAKEKRKTFACSAFSRFSQKLSAAHSFFFCGVGGYRRLFFFTRTSGFYDIARTGFSPFANAIFNPIRKSEIFARGPRFLAPSENQGFSPGDPGFRSIPESEIS